MISFFRKRLAYFIADVGFVVLSCALTKDREKGMFLSVGGLIGAPNLNFRNADVGEGELLAQVLKGNCGRRFRVEFESLRFCRELEFKADFCSVVEEELGTLPRLRLSFRNCERNNRFVDVDLPSELDL